MAIKIFTASMGLAGIIMFLTVFKRNSTTFRLSKKKLLSLYMQSTTKKDRLRYGLTILLKNAQQRTVTIKLIATALLIPSVIQLMINTKSSPKGAWASSVVKSEIIKLSGMVGLVGSIVIIQTLVELANPEKAIKSGKRSTLELEAGRLGIPNIPGKNMDELAVAILTAMQQ